MQLHLRFADDIPGGNTTFTESCIVVWLQVPLAPAARAVKDAKIVRPVMLRAVLAIAKQQGSPRWRSSPEGKRLLHCSRLATVGVFGICALPAIRLLSAAP